MIRAGDRASLWERATGPCRHRTAHSERAVRWRLSLKLAVETVGALIVGIGFLTAGGHFAQAIVTRQTSNFTSIRLVLARYLALEFQLGADILSTAIAPTWQQIGKLGAIAVIRTGLNYFLSREMQEERATVARANGPEENRCTTGD